MEESDVSAGDCVSLFLIQVNLDIPQKWLLFFFLFYLYVTENVPFHFFSQIYLCLTGKKMKRKTVKNIFVLSLQCFDTVGWATGRASGL